MHGLIGGRWGQQALTSEIQSFAKVTTRRRATVSRRCAPPLNQRPTSLPHGFLVDDGQAPVPERH
jgi:hypothetical protein